MLFTFLYEGEQMKNEIRDTFELSFGNLQVLKTIPEMMIEPSWRKKIRELVFEYLFSSHKISNKKETKKL